jgi:arylsulfatase A-like enzyme
MGTKEMARRRFLDSYPLDPHFDPHRNAMKQRSLVLVTVDCLRADHVGFLGYSRPVTPNLDALAENSAVFSDAVVAGAPTYFSFPAILASRYPLALGRDVLGIAPDEPTLATALQDAGYATAAFLAGNPYLSPRFGYDQGFDSFNDFLGAEAGVAQASEQLAPRASFSKLNRWIESLSRRSNLSASAYDEIYFRYCQWQSARENIPMDTLRRYPAANVIVDQAQSWLGGLGDRPFFLWLHLMDPHHPYYPPEESLAALGLPLTTARRARYLNSFWNRGDLGPERLKRHREEVISLYDAGVHWVDKQLSRLADALRNSGRWDETVFAVTADHGEAFLEHGDRYHSPTSLPESVVRVPLLLRAPELPGRRFSQGPFSLIHLAPTLLHAVGVTRPDSFQGRSAWGEISAGNLQADIAITECVDGCCNPMRPAERMRPRLMAVRDGEFKLVINFREGQDYLYDLKNDRGEKSPLPSENRTRDRARLYQAAREHIERSGLPRAILQRSADGRNIDLRWRALLREVQQSMKMTGSDASSPQPAQIAGGTHLML